MTRDRAVAFGPGRVNLLGEHTDYNGGRALPFAIEQGVTATAERLPGDEMVVQARDLGEEDHFDRARPAGAQGWRAFSRGIVAELAADGVDVPAARIEIEADLPRGAGLSSSAALEVAVALALLALAGSESSDPDWLARLCSRVENDWVGARTGLLDQTASLRGRAGHALAIDFATADVQEIPLALSGWKLVVLDSGEAHSHATGAYNERRLECARAAELLGVRHLAAADPVAAAALPEPLARRAQHVIEEDARVGEAVEVLRADELGRLGPLLDASHASLRDLFEASADAVEETVGRLRDAGAAGARMIGGGFGGSVLALFPPGAEPPDGVTHLVPAAGARLIG